jgi:hypothetical protein
MSDNNAEMALQGLISAFLLDVTSYNQRAMGEAA